MVAKTSHTPTLGSANCHQPPILLMWKIPSDDTSINNLYHNLVLLLNLVKQLFIITQGTWVQTWEPNLHISHMEQD
jgi:hypothetical protein